MPCFPPPPPKKILLSLQYIIKYIEKIIQTRRGQCTICNISRNCVWKCTRLHLSSLRSRRLEVVGKREKGRARGRHACLFLARPFFLMSTTIQALDLLQVDLLTNGASLFWPRSGQLYEIRPKRLLRRLTSQRIFISKKFPGRHAPVPPLGSSWSLATSDLSPDGKS